MQHLKAYTGVGSRETPDNILRVMEDIGEKLAYAGWTLRSGAADGADTAFEEGCDRVGGAKEVYIAWEGFSGRTSVEEGILVPTGALVAKAAQIASQTHPAWDRCSRGAKALHTRNVFQVLGQQLDAPSKMLICYGKLDKRGNIQGGTATAWNLACQHDVPCFNLIIPEHYTRITQWLSTQS